VFTLIGHLAQLKPFDLVKAFRVALVGIEVTTPQITAWASRMLIVSSMGVMVAAPQPRKLVNIMELTYTLIPLATGGLKKLSVLENQIEDWRQPIRTVL